jgi:hypothetical protein
MKLSWSSAMQDVLKSGFVSVIYNPMCTILFILVVIVFVAFLWMRRDMVHVRP